MKITFVGHSCFLMELGDCTLIIDPYLTNNPVTDLEPHQVKADYILITHGHHDHFGNALEIAEKNSATIIASFEIAAYCQKKGARAHPMHIGGSFQFPFGRVKLTQALHSSSILENGSLMYAGNPCGFLIETPEGTVYHAGDTGLFGDMALLGSLHPIDLALLPIGDNFVMGIDDAVKAVELLKPRAVIPMHYNTMELIRQDSDDFVEKMGSMAEVIILQPGGSINWPGTRLA